MFVSSKAHASRPHLQFLAKEMAPIMKLKNMHVFISLEMLIADSIDAGD